MQVNIMNTCLYSTYIQASQLIKLNLQSIQLFIQYKNYFGRKLRMH